MYSRNIFYVFVISLIISTSFSLVSSAVAQGNDDKVKSLADILNPDDGKSEDDKNLTSSILAKRYYKKCMDKKSLVFDDSEKDIICSCTSAEMSENLSVEDFKNLYKSTVKGRNARDRMLAFTYAPCMEYVAAAKSKTDCMASGNLYDIVTGKSLICGCVAQLFRQHVIDGAADIMRIASHFEPLALDPLEYYWSKNDNYYVQHKSFLKLCRYNFEYKRDNVK